MSRLRSIQARTFLLFVVPSLFLVVIGALLGYQRVADRTLQSRTGEATAATAATAADFSARLGRVAQQAVSTATHLSLQGGLPSDRELFEVLESNVVSDPLVYGSAYGFAPTVLTDRDRFAPYVFDGPNGLTRIDIGAESYDYTQAEWEWFAGPARDGAARWTAPYFDRDAGGIVMMTYSTPIRFDGEFAGVATIDVPMSALPSQLTGALPTDLRLLVLDRAGLVIWDSAADGEVELRPVAELSPAGTDPSWIQQALSPLPGSVDLEDGTFGGRDQTAFHAPIDDTPWHLVAVLDRGAILTDVQREATAWALGGLLAFLVLGLIAWRASTSSTRRMHELAVQAASLSEGDYDVRLDETEDELGEVARALNRLGRELADREAIRAATQQRRFADLVDTSPRGTLLLDAAQSIVYANPAAMELLSPSGASLEGESLSNILSAKLVASYPDGLPKTRRGERAALGQIELIDENGQPITVSAELAGVGDTDEQELMVLSFRDLRDELRAAGMLAERERFLAGIFQNAGVGIVVTDPDGTIRDANVTFREYVGRDLVALLGRPFADLLHPEERDDGGRILAALGRGALNGFVTEHRYVREGGAVSWGETRSAALRDADDRVERVIVAVTDLTARRRANATFRAVFEHSDDAYMILLRDRVDDANQAALRLFGLDRVEELSFPVFGGAHAPENQPSGLASDLLGREILDAAWGGTTYRGEWSIQRPDGSVAPAGVTLVPIQLGDDDALLVVAHDLTQRKQFEAELVEARDAAESAARAKADFLATMSHEIRTPMNGVIGMIDLLAETSLSADQQRMINTTKDSALALLAIINDVLDFSKIEAGKLELERVPVGVHALVDAVTEMLGTNAANADLSLQSLVELDVPDAFVADPVRLRQILFNLIGNAIKFTAEGGVQVHVSRGESEDGPRILIAIEDTGIGMTQQQIDRLFQPFTQAETSTTRRFGGTGLGLSIVSRLVELMGGRIVVTSEPQVGSTFTVDLPLVEAELERDLPDLDGRTVLVCAEGSPERDSAVAILGRSGCRVEALTVQQLRDHLRGTSALPDAIYLGAQTDALDRMRLRGLAANGRAAAVPFVAGLPPGGSTEAPDLPDTTLVQGMPLTQAGLLQALGQALGLVDVVQPTQASRTAEVTRERAIEAGQLLLVAEDNRTNQEVIRRQLLLLGYYPDVVADGAEAIEAMKDSTYAALLTDCHMPNVDGFALTHHVREREAAEGLSRLPIIAITANALQGEGARCLAEGMDDYLTKPLEMPRLTASLVRWVGPPVGGGPASPLDDEPRPDDTPAPGPAPTGEAARTAASAASTAPASRAPSVDGGGTATDLDQFEVLDLGVLETTLRGDRATARLLLADFVPNARELVDGALAAVVAHDAEELVRIGHTLKSSARAVGALRLGEACQLLEAKAKTTTAADLAAEVDQLQKLFAQVDQAVQEALVESAAEATP